MSKFLVYRASAGSGKTFMLVRKYLGQIFQSPGEYRRILAVTFTNKAADEMKGRILEELDRLSRDPASSKHLDYLKAAFGKTEEWVSENAGRIKSQMLHDYSRISVGTIDSFFQQVLRSFAREAGLSSTFQVELDTDLVLGEFTRYIFTEATNNPALMSWLTDWVNDRMENSETWHRLESDLIRLGSELLKEDILAGFVSDPGAIPSSEQIRELRNYCRNSIREFNEARAEISREAASVISAGGYSVEDFSSGWSGPAGCLVKLAGSDDGPKIKARASLDNPDKWVAKKTAVNTRNDITDNIYPDLNRLMDSAIRLFDDHSEHYISCLAVNKNLYALGFASFLFDFFRDYLKDNDQLLLSLTQPMVNQIIGDNPSPFIYEKTGTFYHHFLIDEFQDTSDLQWKNFKPLIVDSLSADGLSMIVGDIKQSLYRWRNSNWRLLHEQARSDLDAFQSTSEQLIQNQRSRKSVISFNNRIFSGLPGLISDQLMDPAVAADTEVSVQPGIIRDVYLESDQQFGGMADAEGRVEVRFYSTTVKTSGWKDQQAADLPRQVEDLLLNKGYRQEDITFLVRRNAEADKITRILTQSEEYKRSASGSKWSFISSDVFRIANSPVIKMILNAMRYKADPTQKLYGDLFLWDQFILSHPGQTPDPAFRSAGKEAFDSFLAGVDTVDLITFTDELVRTYNLDRNEDDLAYLFQFRDQVKSCMNRGISHLSGFLDWWDAAGQKQMLASENTNSSMRIMTIHKAKGLSSPVIIIPFCNWDFNHNPQRSPWLWVPTEGTPFNQAKYLPVRYASSLTGSYFAESYTSERIDAYLDNLNLLYVAFTRAIDVLLVMCPYGNGFKTVAEAIYNCLKNELDENSVFRSGEPDFINQKEAGTNQAKMHLTTPMITGQLKSKIQHRPANDFVGTRFGKNVHRILENVRSMVDLQPAIARSVGSGLFTQEEADAVENRVRQLLAIPEVGDWFSGEWEILNEAGILAPGQGEKRPDRVMIKKNSVVVTDYKTGVRESKHDRQVGNYMQLLASMGYSDVRGYLLYIETPELVEVRFPADSAQPVLTDRAV